MSTEPERADLPPDLIEAVCEGVFDWSGENVEDDIGGGRPWWDAVTKVVLEVLAGKARIIPLGDAEAARAEVERLRQKIAEYENAITWETSCTSCATVLDSSIKDHDRAERAEAALARARVLAGEWIAVADQADHLTALAAGRAVLQVVGDEPP